METNAMTGTNKLASRILQDARADAEKTLADALASVASMQDACEVRIREMAADHRQRRDAAVKNTIDGCRTRASIDGKKAALAKRREVIERAFADAYAAMLRLDDSARAAILSRVLDAETDGGETIVPAAADRAVMERLLDARKEKALSLSIDNAEIDGGFLILGSGYEKNCSFASILAEVRSDEETNVAKLLFN